LRFTPAPVATSIAAGSVLALGNALRRAIDENLSSGNMAAPPFAMERTKPSHRRDNQNTETRLHNRVIPVPQC
jgi:hypothetical protein